jgi:hypothetical protein
MMRIDDYGLPAMMPMDSVSFHLHAKNFIVCGALIDKRREMKKISQTVWDPCPTGIKGAVTVMLKES